MLVLFATSVLVTGIAMAAMGVGVLLRGRPLVHGCGSVTSCEGCARPCGTDHREET